MSQQDDTQLSTTSKGVSLEHLIKYSFLFSGIATAICTLINGNSDVTYYVKMTFFVIASVLCLVSLLTVITTIMMGLQFFDPQTKNLNTRKGTHYVFPR